MVFASLTFIYIFLPIFFIVYFLFKKNTVVKNIIVCIFSLFFYAWGEPIFVFLLVFSIFINFLCGKKIGIAKENKKFFLFLGIFFNILMLIIFKYTNLFIEIINISGLSKINFQMPLPIGISFYTFQALSYLIDIYNKKVKYQKDFINLLLYISMFPQLIAGPIVRYDDINKMLTTRNETIDRIFYGILRTVLGLSKKIILANQLSIVVDSLLSNNRTILGSFLGIILFMFQLYFDFSGYSDIAIGIGKIIGFDFLENFDFPLLATSMTDFWRKWHISLGSFFRDYVYIPLGGNKKNQYLNIFVVWFLTGIWHGASLNFVLWGLFLAIIIILEKVFKSLFNKEKKDFNLINFILEHLYFIIISFISFTLFYFDNINELFYFMSHFFKYQVCDYETTSILINNLNLLLVSLICIFPLNKIIKKLVLNKFGLKSNNILIIINMLICIVLLVVSTLFLIGGTNNPFMYFRF